MKTWIICAVGFLLSTAAHAQTPPTLTNADVVRLATLRIPEQTIVAVVREAPAVDFQLGALSVTDLTVGHVAPAVIDAMRERAPLATPVGSGMAPTAPARALTLAEAADAAQQVKHDWALSTNIGSSSAVAPASAPIATTTETIETNSHGKNSESYWRGRMAPLQTKKQGDENELASVTTRVEDLRKKYQGVIDANRLNDGRATLFGTSAANPLGTELVRLQTEQTLLKEALAQDNLAIADLEEEGRRAGALPGWFR